MELLEDSAAAKTARARVDQHAHVSVDTVSPPADKDELQMRLKDRSAPAWAKGLTNARGLLTWDDAQYIALVGVQGTLLEALMDTGGACTIMDMAFAKRLGLPVKEQRQAEYGMFTVPGRASPIPYAGCVEGPVRLQFAADVEVIMPFIRLVNHGRPLFIVGATDVLCAGAATAGSFGFAGMGPHQLQGHRGTQGWVKFARGMEEVDVPLVSAPVRGLRFVRHADAEDVQGSAAVLTAAGDAA